MYGIEAVSSVLLEMGPFVEKIRSIESTNPLSKMCEHLLAMKDDWTASRKEYFDQLEKLLEKTETEIESKVLDFLPDRFLEEFLRTYTLAKVKPSGLTHTYNKKLLSSQCSKNCAGFPSKKNRNTTSASMYRCDEYDSVGRLVEHLEQPFVDTKKCKKCDGEVKWNCCLNSPPTFLVFCTKTKDDNHTVTIEKHITMKGQRFEMWGGIALRCGERQKFRAYVREKGDDKNPIFQVTMWKQIAFKDDGTIEKSLKERVILPILLGHRLKYIPYLVVYKAKDKSKYDSLLQEFQHDSGGSLPSTKKFVMNSNDNMFIDMDNRPKSADGRKARREAVALGLRPKSGFSSTGNINQLTKKKKRQKKEEKEEEEEAPPEKKDEDSNRRSNHDLERENQRLEVLLSRSRLQVQNLKKMLQRMDSGIQFRSRFYDVFEENEQDQERRTVEFDEETFRNAILVLPNMFDVKDE